MFLGATQRLERVGAGTDVGQLPWTGLRVTVGAFKIAGELVPLDRAIPRPRTGALFTGTVSVKRSRFIT
jgi:hypothetical protein